MASSRAANIDILMASRREGAAAGGGAVQGVLLSLPPREEMDEDAGKGP